MFDEISHNPINKNIINNNANDSKGEILIDNNFRNENNLLLNTNKTKNNDKNQLSKNNEVFIDIKPVIAKKKEDRIICFSRRRKCPKNIDDLTGFLITFSFFIFFSILMTICLLFAKKKPIISDFLKTFYNWVIIFIWITSITSLICLTDAASSDPGRQRGTPIPKYKYEKGKIRKIVGGQKYILKYCTTCNLIRDIRTFHCNICGLCIEKHDHHCNYLSNCVGVYNYKKFFIFLISACIHVSIIFITCIHFIIFGQASGDDGYEWISFLITLTIIFAGFFEFFTIWMIIQHIGIIIQNRTTREFIKKKEYGIYNKGCKENCKEALCSNSIKEL